MSFESKLKALLSKKKIEDNPKSTDPSINWIMNQYANYDMLNKLAKAAYSIKENYVYIHPEAVDKYQIKPNEPAFTLFSHTNREDRGRTPFERLRVSVDFEGSFDSLMDEKGDRLVNVKLHLQKGSQITYDYISIKALLTENKEVVFDDESTDKPSITLTEGMRYHFMGSINAHFQKEEVENRLELMLEHAVKGLPKEEVSNPTEAKPKKRTARATRKPKASTSKPENVKSTSKNSSESKKEDAKTKSKSANTKKVEVGEKA